MIEGDQVMIQNIEDPQAQRSVLGEPLLSCSQAPLTGFYRTGCCETGADDAGSHTVCILATAEFLAFSKSVGNDLSTPIPEYGFPGIKPGDRWCLCAARWLEALEAGCPPQVILEATNQRALEILDLDDLRAHAIS